jgi:lysophospholipase L1-like esterase
VELTDYPKKNAPAASDLVMIVDAEDTTESPAGSTKQATLGSLPFDPPGSAAGALAAAQSAQSAATAAQSAAAAKVGMVNGKTGASVTLLPADVGAEPAGTAAPLVQAEATRAQSAEALLLPRAGGQVGPLLTVPPVVVFDGDSLTFGAGCIPYYAFPAGQDYPSQVAAALPAQGTYYNVGVGGETIAAMLANGPTVVDPKFVTGAENVVVICGGTNDIFYSDSDPYPNIVAYCQARKSAGWKVIVGTLGPRSDTGVPADYETKRQSVNTRIRANAISGGWADAIADFGADPTIGAAGVQTNAQYFAGDNVHLSVLGYRVRASIVLKALASLGIYGHLQDDKPVLNSDIWMPANTLSAQIYTALPVYGNISPTFYSGWSLVHSQVQVVGATVSIPQDWQSFNIYAAHTRSGTAAGSALINANWGALPVMNYGSAPGNLAASPTSGPPTAITPATDLLETTLLTSSDVPNVCGGNPRVIWGISIERNGLAAQDTLTDALDLMGIYLVRTA